MGRDAEGVFDVGEKTTDGEIEEAKLKSLWVGRRHGVLVFI